MYQLRLARLAADPKARERATNRMSAERITFVAEQLACAPLSEFGSKTQLKIYELAVAAIKAVDAWEDRMNTDA